MSAHAIIQGFAMGAGLIIAIGPQNTFVLRQGIKRKHVFLSAIICILTDTFLISLGVLGLGAILNLHPIFIETAKWFGAIFLFCYGLMSFYSAIKPKPLEHNNTKGSTLSSKQITLMLLALGLLNPHAYLDTVILIGSVAAQHASYGRYYFGFGAILASAAWFFIIAYGAKALTPFFEKPNVWRYLDIITGVIMFSVMLSLIL